LKHTCYKTQGTGFVIETWQFPNPASIITVCDNNILGPYFRALSLDSDIWRRKESLKTREDMECSLSCAYLSSKSSEDYLLTY